MKLFTSVAVATLFSVSVFGQTNLQALVETEKAFAAMAAEKGTKSAFLANMSDDAVLSLPNKVNGKSYWMAKEESTELLVWAPDFAAVSSNGIIGYTTGSWEYRAEGKNSASIDHGEFVSLWQRQPNGSYKLALDIGISHGKPARLSADWSTYPDTVKETNEKNSSAADHANRFFESAAGNELQKAYKAFLADDVRAYREGAMPIIGKKAFLDFLKKEKPQAAFAKRSVFFGSADLAYIVNTYTLTLDGRKAETGNFVQIWKLRGGRWEIVVDIFKPVPA